MYSGNYRWKTKILEKRSKQLYQYGAIYYLEFRQGCGGKGEGLPKRNFFFEFFKKYFAKLWTNVQNKIGTTLKISLYSKKKSVNSTQATPCINCKDFLMISRT